MDMMRQLLAGETPAKTKLLLPTELVLRQSAAVPPPVRTSAASAPVRR
jgi:hypothetical protein